MMVRKKEYKKHDYLINTYGSFAEARNDKDHVDERRYSSILKMTAGGTLVMGIWSLIKCFMGVLGDVENELVAKEVPVLIAIFGSALLFAFFFVIGISFRYIIWRGARREAESGRKRNGYIVLAFFLLTYGVYAIVSFIYRAAVKGTDAQDVLKFVFDATSFAILCELISSAFRLRKVRDELKASGSGGEL